MTPDELLAQHNGDTAHARHVADLALAIFDGSAALHDGKPKARRLLETGAILHNVALDHDERKHHTLGRDIVLGAALDGTSDDERAMIACLVAFHRKKVRAETEPAFVRLDAHDQTRTLQLAAMLRVADGLDYSQTQTTRIDHVGVAHGHLHLQLSGAHALANAARAEAKSDLWRQVFDGELLWEVSASADGEADPVPPAPVTLSAPDNAEADEGPRKLRPDDTLADATRKVLRRHFGKLLSYEAKIRAGDDVEDVHQMRVATRRLRAALQVLGPAVAPKRAQAFRRRLRSVAAALGDVRDRDVFLEHVHDYSVSLDEGRRTGLAPLIEGLEHDQRAARRRLLKRLDGRRYARFKQECAHFLTASDASDAPAPVPTPRVRYAAGSAILQRYEHLRAYETVVPAHGEHIDPEKMALLHQMRIAGKHLRYTLELFADALGAGADTALKPLMALQEHLGALQDTEVALAYIGSLLPDAPAEVGAYVDARHAATDSLLGELPALWERVVGEKYRQALVKMLVKL